MSDTIQNLKGGEFIIKDVPTSEIFTLEELTDEQKMLRDSVRKFSFGFSGVGIRTGIRFCQTVSSEFCSGS